MPWQPVNANANSKGPAEVRRMLCLHQRTRFTSFFLSFHVSYCCVSFGCCFAASVLLPPAPQAPGYGQGDFSHFSWLRAQHRDTLKSSSGLACHDIHLYFCRIRFWSITITRGIAGGAGAGNVGASNAGANAERFRRSSKCAVAIAQASYMSLWSLSV